jgi:hypothetical protein
MPVWRLNAAMKWLTLENPTWCEVHAPRFGLGREPARGELHLGSERKSCHVRKRLLADNLVRGAAFVMVPLLYHVGALALWHLHLAAALFALFKMVPLAGAPR